MEDTSCSACHKRFQEESPPKVLECGHNVCAKCLEKFFDSDSVTRCAICQAEITKKESWPTNHSLLNLSKLYKKLLNDEKHVKTAIAEFQEDIMEKVTAITNEMNNTHCSTKEKVAAMTTEINNIHCSTMKKVTAMTNEMNNTHCSTKEKVTAMTNEINNIHCSTMEKVTEMTSEMNNTHCSTMEKVTALRKEMNNTHCSTMENVTAMTKEIDNTQCSTMEKVAALRKEMNNTHCSTMENVTAMSKEIDNTQCSTMEKVAALRKKINNDLGSIRTYTEIAKVETLKMDDFEYCEDYLDEVYRRCKTGLVYAIYFIEAEKKFGQVTVFGDKIWVHCASETIPKQERNVTHVMFQDLKKSIGEDGLHVFLQIGYSKFRVEYFLEVRPIKGQSLQFVKLCTGETGPSYKGTLYTEHQSPNTNELLLYIDNYISNGEKKTGKFDYNLIYQPVTSCEVGEYVVDGYGDDGRFRIFKIKSEGEYNYILGKIVSPCNFLHEISFDSKIDNKILDCGITFKIK